MKISHTPPVACSFEIEGRQENTIVLDKEARRDTIVLGHWASNTISAPLSLARLM